MNRPTVRQAFLAVALIIEFCPEMLKKATKMTRKLENAGYLAPKLLF
jgi:hypothetical protein